MEWTRAVAIGLLFILFVATIRLLGDFSPQDKPNRIRFMSRIGVFGAMAAILYAVPVFKFPVPFFPSFLEFHFDEIPAFIAGFAYGPFAGFSVVALKTVLKLMFDGTRTMFVGELTDLVLSSVYVVVAAIVYQKKRTLKGAGLGFLIATAIQIVAAMVLNVYVIIPFYTHAMGYLPEDLLYLMTKAVPAIKDVGWSYALLAVLPFNAMKDGIVIVVTFLVYRSVHKLFRIDAPRRKKRTGR